MNIEIGAPCQTIACPTITVSVHLSPPKLRTSPLASSTLPPSAPTWATINTPKKCDHLDVLTGTVTTSLLSPASSASWNMTSSPLGAHSSTSTSPLHGFPGTKSIGPLPFALSGLKGALHFDDNGNLLENELFSSPEKPDSPMVMKSQRFGSVTATTLRAKPYDKQNKSTRTKKPGNKENWEPATPNPIEAPVDAIAGPSGALSKKKNTARRGPGRPRTRQPADSTAANKPKPSKITKPRSARKPASPPKVFFSTDHAYNKARLERLLPNRCAGSKEGANRGELCVPVFQVTEDDMIEAWVWKEKSLCGYCDVWFDPHA